MGKRISGKRLALAALLLAVLLGVTGCIVQPDLIETGPSDAPDVLPFETAPPTSPAPTERATALATTPPPEATAEPPRSTDVISLPPLSTAPPSATLPQSPGQTQAPPTPTPGTVLRNGSSGEAVTDMQQRLKELGYYSGAVDGQFGSGTESALREFQRENSLSVDGVAGERTLSTLSAANAIPKPETTATGSANATSRPTLISYTPSTPGTYGYLEPGMSGTAVRQLQNRLQDLGYYTGTPDGVYSEETQQAVVAFQQRNGEWVDGLAGPDTQEQLYGPDALPAQSTGN